MSSIIKGLAKACIPTTTRGKGLSSALYASQHQEKVYTCPLSLPCTRKGLAMLLPPKHKDKVY